MTDDENTKKRLGDFEIIRELGRGGMGIVYEARQVSLNRKVALKVISGSLGLSSKAVLRFQREAEAAGKLHHTNIVPIYFTGEDDGAHYYAMELIDGPSLQQVIGNLRKEQKDGSPAASSPPEDGDSSAGHVGLSTIPNELPSWVTDTFGGQADPGSGSAASSSSLTASDSSSSLQSGVHYFDTVARMIAEVADALDHAHENGVIHRDIKPANLLLSPDGRLSVNDFGLARMLEQPGMTMSGEFVGSPLYMSPEQITAGRVPLDHRTDIFSLGSTLYELLILAPPFPGRGRDEVMSQILHKDPRRPRSVSKKVPLDLETICLKAMEKDPDRRYQTAGQLAEDLRRFVNRHAISARRIGPLGRAAKFIRRHKAPVATAAVAVLVMAVAGGLIWKYWPEARLTLTPPWQLTRDSGLTTDPTLSSNGKLLAYASDRGAKKNLDIWVQELDGGQPNGEPRQLTFHEADDREPVFSPDSKSLAFRSERDGGGIYVVPVDGGEKQSVRLIAKHGRRPRYSPDGARIAFWRGHEGGDDVRSGEIYVVPSADGAPRKLQAHFLSARYPVWLPDGEQLLFYGSGTADPQASPEVRTVDLWITPIDGGPAVATGAGRVFESHGLSIRNINPSLWVPERNLVFVSARFQESLNLWAIPISPATGKAEGSLHRITTGTLKQLHPWVSGDRIVFASTQLNVDVWSLPLTGEDGRSAAEPDRLTRNPATELYGSASADGKKVVFTSDRSGEQRIWMKDLDAGGKETLLRTGQRSHFWPLLSPDGSKLAYRADGAKLFVMELNTGESRRCTEAWAGPWGWSSDGKLLSFMAPGPGSPALVGIFNTETAETFIALRHPEYNIYQGHFSPDDRWIAFNAVPRSGGSRLFIAPFNVDENEAIDEGEWIPITAASGFDDKPNWSKDGNLLYFLSERDGSRCIWAQQLEPETKRPLGDAFEIKHFGDTSSSPMNVSIGNIELFVTRDRILFNSGEMTGNIWTAELKQE